MKPFQLHKDFLLEAIDQRQSPGTLSVIYPKSPIDDGAGDKCMTSNLTATSKVKAFSLGSAPPRPRQAGGGTPPVPLGGGGI